MFIFILENVSGLAVSPAKKEINFQPNYESSYDYHVFGIPKERVVDISLVGDLAKYAEASKTSLTGGGNFVVDLKLPEKIEKPGKHRIGVKVSERIDPELTSMIGTSVNIIVAIDIFVPYPGEYVEINSFRANNVNVGEPIIFNFKLTSRGKNTANFKPRIDIANENGNLLESLAMSERSLDTGESIELKKEFETVGYNSGRYGAVLVVDYGGVTNADTLFRIGDLEIDIINYTKKFDIGGLRKFEILVESGWNDLISGVYANVFVFNNSGKLIEFKSTTETLKPWEEKIIEGYFDTSKFAPGKYNANITLFYFGKDTGSSTSEVVEIELIEQKEEKTWLIVGIVVSSVLFFGLVIFLILKIFKRKKKK